MTGTLLMSIRMSCVLLVSALVLGAGTRAGYPATTYLTADEVRATLVGYTLTGKDWAEFYQSDGTLHGRLRTFGLNYDGKWKVVDGKVCYEYQDPAQNRCSRLMRDGDTVRHFTVDGSPKPDGVARRFEGNRTASL